MINFIKRQTIGSWLVLAGALLALVSVIIFLVNATTGYFRSLPMVGWIPVCSFIAIVLAVLSIVFANKLKRFADIGVIVAVILLCLSLGLFIMDRVEIFGDVWFMSLVLPPSEAEIAAADGAITGIVFYAVSILVLVASSFFKLLNLPAEEQAAMRQPQH